MTSQASLLYSEGLKLRSCLKISSRPAYTGNHYKWISQYMINNNNINNNNNKKNLNPPVVLKYWVGIRRGIAMRHGQVGILSLGW